MTWLASELSREVLLPPGEGGAKRRMSREILLPSGAGGAKRRMRVRPKRTVAVSRTATSRFARTPSPTPPPTGRGFWQPDFRVRRWRKAPDEPRDPSPLGRRWRKAPDEPRNPSPLGRRWRKAPDEGTGEACSGSLACCHSALRPHPLPHPSPDGEGLLAAGLPRQTNRMIDRTANFTTSNLRQAPRFTAAKMT